MAQQFPELPNPDIDPVVFPPPVNVDLPAPGQPFTTETAVAKGGDDGTGPLVGAGDSGISGPSPVGGIEIALVALITGAVSAALWLTRKRFSL